MRIGICLGLEGLEKISGAGFDYLETAINVLAGMDREKFAEAKRLLRDSPIKVEAGNCFFPWDLKIVGSEAEPAKIQDYIKKTMERLGELSARIAVIGSGGPRRIPDGWDLSKGRAQFTEALRWIGDEAALYGITAALEPLQQAETNLINTIREGAALVEKVNHPQVKLLADFFHMRKEDEPMENIKDGGKLLVHCHISNSHGRTPPRDMGEDEYLSFFKELKSVGYHGRVSVEAPFQNLEEDGPLACTVLQKLAATVGL
ncbi:MAG: sugar phosphate isomerase/epimerase family protein [Bacillota bacterium]